MCIRDSHLPLDDLARLIEINRGRICGLNQGTQTVDELSRYFSVCMNGACIQITVNDELHNNPTLSEVEETLNG